MFAAERFEIARVVPQNFKSYVRDLREAARDRQFRHPQEQLAITLTADDRCALLQRMQELQQSPTEETSIRTYGDVGEVLILYAEGVRSGPAI
jgi:hypothetical protein